MPIVGSTVLVSDYPGNVRVFATDTDGPDCRLAAPIAQNYGFANAVGIAQVGGGIYMTQQGSGDLIQINNNGTFDQNIVGGIPFGDRHRGGPAHWEPFLFPPAVSTSSIR